MTLSQGCAAPRAPLHQAFIPPRPERGRIDWPQVLRSAGFTRIEVQARPEWHDRYTRVYQVALDLGDPGDDTLVGSLQDKARHHLPLADLRYRVAVTATAPTRPPDQG